MNQFRLGTKAIQEINRFQAVLQRFPRAERLSMIRYLKKTNVKTTPTSSVSNVRTIGVLSRAAKLKLARIARARPRTANGTFVAARRTTARSRAA